MYLRKCGNTFLFLILAGFIFITGCSSSSNSIRYGSNNNETEEKEDDIRYEKNEEPVENKIPSIVEENDPDESPEDLASVDISVLEKYSPDSTGLASNLKEKMLMEIIRYINTPYKFGGNSKKGMDCSGFTQTVYGNCSIPLLRSAKEQFTEGVVIDSKDDLKFGDLVFFDTRRGTKPGHVGIYLGDNLFVHASSKKGVIVTPLDTDYYSRHYMGARRIEQSVGFQ